jgi:hypothetical protein
VGDAAGSSVQVGEGLGNGMAVGTRTGIAQPTDSSRLIPSSSFKEIPIERFIWSLPEL